MELLMWLLLVGRALGFLVPYMVGIAGGLIVMHVVPSETPAACKFLLFSSVTAGVVAGIKGQASAE